MFLEYFLADSCDNQLYPVTDAATPQVGESQTNVTKVEFFKFTSGDFAGVPSGFRIYDVNNNFTDVGNTNQTNVEWAYEIEVLTGEDLMYCKVCFSTMASTLVLRRITFKSNIRGFDGVGLSCLNEASTNFRGRSFKGVSVVSTEAITNIALLYNFC